MARIPILGLVTIEIGSAIRLVSSSTDLKYPACDRQAAATTANQMPSANGSRAKPAATQSSYTNLPAARGQEIFLLHLADVEAGHGFAQFFAGFKHGFGVFEMRRGFHNGFGTGFGIAGLKNT